MREVWKTVPGFEGMYEVSDRGRARSLPRTVKYAGGSDRRLRGVMLKVTYVKGYPRVDFCLDGVRIPIELHKAIALTFHGPRPPFMEVCHNDGKRRNVAASNLRYDTKDANEADKIAHGTTNRGERGGNCRLTRRQVRTIIQSADVTSALADRYGISARHIRKIRSRDRWGWL